MVLAIAGGLTLASCDKLGLASSVECGSEDSQKLVIETVKNELSKKSLTQLKELLNEGITGINVSKVRALNDQITYSLTDVRTSHNDAQSKKKLCVAVLNAKVNPNILNEANASRSIVDDNTIQDFALMSDIPFEQGKLSYNLEYSVQPTDDGKKIYTEISNADLGINFLSQVIKDILLKPLRQHQQMEQAQENLQEASASAMAAAEAAAEAAQYESDQEAYIQLQLDDAQKNLDKANEKLNLVWGALPKATRNQILDNQRSWLKKRELECRLSSVDADNKELERRQCETRLTNQRTNELQQLLNNEESVDAAGE